jgi:flap endonuclease-1
MGLKFKELVVKREISIGDLKGRVLAVDSMNLLYQFLTTIRGPDGSVLTDANGRVTSHLIGLFSRTTSLIEQGLKLVFVFDGKAPEIKQKTWEKRTAIKEEASLKLQEAEEAGDIESMKKFSARTAVLTKDMVEDAKNLITALGLPIIQAPSEGEAQTAYMVKKGDAYASVSQDYDNLTFGCPIMIKNLSIAGKRKMTGKLGYQTIKPEEIHLDDVLKELSLTLDELIVLAILVGTDYNPRGIKGIGPKKGLKLVKEHKSDFAAIFSEINWSETYPDITWEEIFDTIKNMPVSDSYELEWQNIDEDSLRKLLIEGHGFSVERVEGKLVALEKAKKEQSQKGLSSFF